MLLAHCGTSWAVGRTQGEVWRSDRCIDPQLSIPLIKTLYRTVLWYLCFAKTLYRIVLWYLCFAVCANFSYAWRRCGAGEAVVHAAVRCLVRRAT